MTNKLLTNNTASPSPKRRWIVILLLCAIGAGGYVYYTNTGKNGTPGAGAAGGRHGGPGGGADKPLPVITAIATAEDVNIYLNGLGAVTPLATVTVKSRIDGELTRIYFKEGQMVRKGELLAEIDQRPYQAALTQAEGQLMRDKALLANAKIDLDRYLTLLKEDSIASQQADTQRALVEQYHGTVLVDEGLLATARLNLTYSKVTAPVAGRAGLRQVDLGNVVHAADTTGLVIITQLQPMSVLFTLPEDNIPALQQRLNNGKKIAVDAFDRAFKEKISSGTLETIDNQIDPTTGMVKLKATFGNEALNLFPSQFVNAKLLLDTHHNVITIPSSGVQHGRTNTFVFVVNKDKTVSQRPVVIGVNQIDKTEIVSGLQTGEVVVTDGTDKLHEGSKVEPAAAFDAGTKHGTSAKTGPGAHTKS